MMPSKSWLSRSRTVYSWIPTFSILCGSAGQPRWLDVTATATAVVINLRRFMDSLLLVLHGEQKSDTILRSGAWNLNPGEPFHPLRALFPVSMFVAFRGS